MLYISSNTLFVNNIKKDIMQITLFLFSLKELNQVNKILSKFKYFKKILISKVIKSEIIKLIK